MMTYSLLAPDYPSLVRYISGAFIVLGLFFVVPIVLLIGFDFVVWVYRICWSRPWQESRNGVVIIVVVVLQSRADQHTRVSVYKRIITMSNTTGYMHEATIISILY
ncbi:hypothetical protein CGGC5_v014797 [Colletotrichum fructicola Nara gc5]|uniref:Uncharacterized protein n=1 Tax=Colletotrichum fructicola (strain Nara gc5) TaxID=1213859 RepID=A0A7J6II25_COLFN|nr:hypothetical protein CGGC5_v014797 [Colletotrichum fructicola Nara gc5]